MIETMIGAREDDLINAMSLRRYRRSFAGLSLLQRMQNLCRHMSGVPRSSTIEEDDFLHAFDFHGSQLSVDDLVGDHCTLAPGGVSQDPSSPFGTSYGESDVAESEDFSDSGMLQALSLPFRFLSSN